MQGLIGVTRIYWKHAAILLATGMLFPLAALHSGAQDRPKRPRITGIDHVRLYVTDIGKANAFYAKLMGNRPTKTAYGCRTASLPCFPVNTHQQIELQQVSWLTPKNLLCEDAYNTDNVEQMRGYLREHKVGVTSITKDPNGARHFELHDPEGNPLSFIQRAERDVDLLGFKLYWYGGFKDDGLDWYEIQVPDGDNWIEYMLNIPANAAHKELGVQNHFSLGARDVHAAAEQLRQNGVKEIAGPGIGRDGKWGLNAYDPDGTRVEVMEFTPAKSPCCHAYTAPPPTP